MDGNDATYCTTGTWLGLPFWLSIGKVYTLVLLDYEGTGIDTLMNDTHLFVLLPAISSAF